MGVVHDDETAHRADVQRRLKCASLLCLIFLIAEIVGGIISGSLAVLSDAAHLSSDLMSFLFAVGASHLAAMKGSARFTYGHRRWEVLAALFSMCSLALCSLYIWGEGIRRLVLHFTATAGVIEDVDGEVMSIIAAIGVAVNIALAFVLGVENHVHMPSDNHDHEHSHSHAESSESSICTVASIDTDGSTNNGKKKSSPLSFEFGDKSFMQHDHSHHSHDASEKIGDSNIKQSKPKENINLRAAYIHVLSDLVQSVAVLIAGIVIRYKPDWQIIDPILSVIFSTIIFFSTIGIVRSSMNVLLEGTPPDVNMSELESSIKSITGVSCICSIHVWSISHGATALTAHIQTSNANIVQRLVQRIATSDFGIEHITIQAQKDCSCSKRKHHSYNPNEEKNPQGGESDYNYDGDDSDNNLELASLVDEQNIV